MTNQYYPDVLLKIYVDSTLQQYVHYYDYAATPYIVTSYKAGSVIKIMAQYNWNG